MKVVINKCYGGFSLSQAVIKELGFESIDHCAKYGFVYNNDFGLSGDGEECRKHPKLIEAIEKVGIENASGRLANLVIVDVPDNASWYIDNYDGIETLHENHQSW